ncbi:50S ribosomal protein L15 [Candidatus Levyibacteriota bacterium]|nr:50S ribosomal protein L15 [Candidatus Levybacteria bacterium]MSU25717.1 50S ribosomal protein L15 [Candidatus Levybacteria bacterium]GDX62370.1 50S ribosomal protein L15 [Candidatus Levybacteria bacterium]
MNLSNLSSIIEKKKRRLGQGHGSGRVKTSGRGTKGRKARGKVPIFFEGGALPLIKKLPFLRGKNRNKSFKKKPITININSLSVFKAGNIVDIESLVKEKIVDPREAKIYGVKILGDGNISVALTIKIQATKGAIKKIELAGGNFKKA